MAIAAVAYSESLQMNDAAGPIDMRDSAALATGQFNANDADALIAAISMGRNFSPRRRHRSASARSPSPGSATSDRSKFSNRF